MSHKHTYHRNDPYHCDVCGHHKQIRGTDAELYKGTGKFLFWWFIGIPVILTALLMACSSL